MNSPNQKLMVCQYVELGSFNEGSEGFQNSVCSIQFFAKCGIILLLSFRFLLKKEMGFHSPATFCCHRPLLVARVGRASLNLFQNYFWQHFLDCPASGKPMYTHTLTRFLYCKSERCCILGSSLTALHCMAHDT